MPTWKVDSLPTWAVWLARVPGRGQPGSWLSGHRRPLQQALVQAFSRKLRRVPVMGFNYGFKLLSGPGLIHEPLALAPNWG